jgi:hypothetical protein
MMTDPRRRFGTSRSTKQPSDDQAQLALVRAVATVVSERRRRTETCMLELMAVEGIGDLYMKNKGADEEKGTEEKGPSPLYSVAGVRK